MRRTLTGLLFIITLTLGACSEAAPTRPAPAVVTTAAPTQTSQPSATPTMLPSATPVPVTPSPTPCADQRGRLTDTSIDAPVLQSPLRVHIYTPPCFNPAGEARYPVLYLLHGQSYTNLHWDDLGADEAADRLISSGEAGPFLIVMPKEDEDLIVVSESKYGQALVESLIPWVDATYPTCAKASCRAIGGISRGAGWALHLALRHADLFGAVGAHSPAVFFGESKHLQENLAAIPEGEVPHFYVDSGRADRYLFSAVDFEQALNLAGVAHDWYLFEGIHDDAYWAAHIDRYIGWYADFFN